MKEVTICDGGRFQGIWRSVISSTSAVELAYVPEKGGYSLFKLQDRVRDEMVRTVVTVEPREGFDSVHDSVVVKSSWHREHRMGQSSSGKSRDVIFGEGKLSENHFVLATPTGILAKPTRVQQWRYLASEEVTGSVHAFGAYRGDGVTVGSYRIIAGFSGDDPEFGQEFSSLQDALDRVVVPGSFLRRAAKQRKEFVLFFVPEKKILEDELLVRKILHRPLPEVVARWRDLAHIGGDPSLLDSPSPLQVFWSRCNSATWMGYLLRDCYGEPGWPTMERLVPMYAECLEGFRPVLTSTDHLCQRGLRDAEESLAILRGGKPEKRFWDYGTCVLSGLLKAMAVQASKSWTEKRLEDEAALAAIIRKHIPILPEQ